MLTEIVEAVGTRSTRFEAAVQKKEESRVTLIDMAASTSIASNFVLVTFDSEIHTRTSVVFDEDKALRHGASTVERMIRFVIGEVRTGVR